MITLELFFRVLEFLQGKGLLNIDVRNMPLDEFVELADKYVDWRAVEERKKSDSGIDD